MHSQKRRLGAIEFLEPRQLMAVDTLSAASPGVEPSAMIVVQIPPVYGDAATNDGYDAGVWSWPADSFSYAIEREMEDSGGQRTTEDINSGQEGEVRESDVNYPPGIAEIDFVEVAGGNDASGESANKDLAFAELDEAESQYNPYR